MKGYPKDSDLQHGQCFCGLVRQEKDGEVVQEWVLLQKLDAFTNSYKCVEYPIHLRVMQDQVVSWEHIKMPVTIPNYVAA